MTGYIISPQDITIDGIGDTSQEALADLADHVGLTVEQMSPYVHVYPATARLLDAVRTRGSGPEVNWCVNDDGVADLEGGEE